MAYFKCTKVSGGLKLIVTCDANFAGSVITCTDGTHTYQKTCPSSSPYEVEYEGLVAGTYTISGVAQGVTHSTTVVMSDVTESLYSTPEGSTVLPTDDIETWLHCGNIWNKSYTTLSEVLADSTTLLALMSDNNAVDYMVRSKSWLNKGLVPIMTSNTTPSGVAFASSEVSGFNAYKCFSNIPTETNGGWQASSTANEYVGYDFGTPVKISLVKLAPYMAPNQSSRVNHYKIQGTSVANPSESDWVDLTETLTAPNTRESTYRATTQYVTINTSQTYSKYRAYVIDSNNYEIVIAELQFYALEEGITDNSTAMTDIGANNYCANTLLADSDWCDAICNSTYFESVLNVKVPTMTDNTHPSGTCFASSIAGSSLSYAPYKAFDNDDSTYWWDNVAGTYIGYAFDNAVKVKMVYLKENTQYNVTDVCVRGTNDPITISNIGAVTSSPTFNDIKDVTLSTPTSGEKIILDTNDTAYKAHCVLSKAPSGFLTATTLQFYGREDV